MTQEDVCVCVCVYIYIYICMCIYIYIYACQGKEIESRKNEMHEAMVNSKIDKDR